MVERTPELILGLVGGVLGIIAVPSLFILGGLLLPFGGGWIVIAAIGGLLFSILGLIGAAFVRSHPRPASLLMLISGGLGLFVALGGWVGALLLLVAGIIALIRREKKTERAPPSAVSIAPPAPAPSPAVAGGMMFCRECGKQIPRESKFCQTCGAKLV